jgi:hypothetical protein
MGFTIEDMNLMAKDRYHMEFIAGKRDEIPLQKVSFR